jgi:transposase
MDDVTDDARAGGFRRIEVLTGPGRRRRWSEDTKARIVEETLVPGAVVAEVARRWQVCPQQVFGWQRERRLGGSVEAPSLGFVEIVPEAPRIEEEPSGSASTATRHVAPVEVRLAGAVLRNGPDTDAALLTMVLRALRAAAA